MNDHDEDEPHPPPVGPFLATARSRQLPCRRKNTALDKIRENNVVSNLFRSYSISNSAADSFFSHPPFLDDSDQPSAIDSRKSPFDRSLVGAKSPQVDQPKLKWGMGGRWATTQAVTPDGGGGMIHGFPFPTETNQDVHQRSKVGGGNFWVTV